jgi:DNA-binding MarR family transcriptional regulator
LFDDQPCSLADPGRRDPLAAWATLEISSGKLTELAKLLGRDSSTLTCAVRRMEKRREKDSSLVDKMERLRREILNQVIKA